MVVVERVGTVATITMNRPQRRNALSQLMLEALTEAFTATASTDARGIVLAGAGPVFCAGHDFADLAGSDEPAMRHMLETCAHLMQVIQEVPQPVIARVQGLATAAGCQLVATCDLAVASVHAAFAAPGGKGGWFCHTPMVAIARTIGRKQAMELALSGDPIDAPTALAWGLVNAVVPEDELDAAVVSLMARVTRGSAQSKAAGKRTLYAQMSMPQSAAYEYATDVMARTSQSADAQEGMHAFLEKRAPSWRRD